MPTTSAETAADARLTWSGEDGAEARAREDLGRIADEVQRAYPDLLTLAVIGAFGRGEGAMRRTVSGFAPWNDYDLLLVTPTRQGWERIAPLCARLTRDGDLPGLDIVPFTPRDVVRAAASMLVHDARECHVMLRGTAEPLTAVPRVPVPQTEALVLLLNRMVCLLECPPSGMASIPPDPVRFASQVSKAVLAVVDAGLVRGSEYAVRYRDKVTRFAAASRDRPLVEAAEAALAFRREPGPRPWGSERWVLACDRLVEAIGQFVPGAGRCPERTAATLWRRRFMPLRATLRSLLRGRAPDVRRRAVECGELLILASSGMEGLRRTHMLASAHCFLARLEPLPPFTDWAGAAERAVQCWFAVCYG